MTVWTFTLDLRKFVVNTEGYMDGNHLMQNTAHPTVWLFLLQLPSHQSARQQHISCNVAPSYVFCPSRPDFMQPRLPVRWNSVGPPSTLSFSPRMCRSVAVDLSFFSTETLLCSCQNRPVPCTAPGWLEALSRGCPLLPGCTCMLESEEDGWLDPDCVVLSLRIQTPVFL